MRATRRFELAVFDQLLACVLLGRLQEPVPRLVRSGVDLHQRFFDQRRQQIEHALFARDVRRDAFHPLQREAVGKDREPSEKAALLRRQQIVTPVDGRAHRLLARKRGAAAAAQDAKPFVQALGEIVDRQHPDARRSQLDGERDAVQSPANLADDGRVAVRKRESAVGGYGALDEEPDRTVGQRLRGRDAPGVLDAGDGQ